ncbi:FAS1-like dehydratase domain-containing protein [Mycolicibacterium sp. XJ1819]
MRIELGKVREFARATRSQRAEHYDADVGISPVTFLVSSAFWQAPESSPVRGKIDLARALHGSQEFVFHDQPPAVGALLTGHMHIGNQYEKDGKRGGTMTFTEIVTEFTDQNGRLVAEMTSTLIETSRPAAGS